MIREEEAGGEGNRGIVQDKDGWMRWLRKEVTEVRVESVGRERTEDYVDKGRTRRSAREGGKRAGKNWWREKRDGQGGVESPSGLAGGAGG